MLASLSILDEVILCDIYPAREKPIEGVTSKLIYDNLKDGIAKEMIHKEDVLDYIKNHVSQWMVRYLVIRHVKRLPM